MRATFAGLNTMVRGIMANQLGLDTTGHNITNAGTEGYSRQTVTLATTRGEERAGLSGNVMVGTGVDALAVERARNVYADIQYRNENPSQKYYETMAVNYDKLETIFDDSKNLGIESALNKFYQTWVDLSTNASNSSARTQVIEQGKNLSDLIQTATSELQEQIRSEYDDLKSELLQVDDILEEIVQFNKQIVAQEVTGATANDLRDNRDLLVDKLSNYVNISVTESELGAYQINSSGVTLVNGTTRAHLLISDGVSSKLYGVDYGITDYSIKIKESNIVFLPQNGILKARLDSIAEDKSYIDKMAGIASFMLTTFNDQHKQGWDLNGDYKFINEDGVNVTSTTNEGDLTLVEYMKSDGTYLTASEAQEAGVKLSDDGKYMLGTDEIIRINGSAVYKNSAGEILKKVSDTINFFGKDDIDYQYRYDAEKDIYYLHKEDPDANKKENDLTGVRIIAALEVNSKFSEIHGDRYIAATTSKQYVETSNGEIKKWIDMNWGDRTGDGTNAVYLSELFNISQKTILDDNKANALVYRNAIRRDDDGNPIDDQGNRIFFDDEYYLTTDETGTTRKLDSDGNPIHVYDLYALTPMATLSVNSFYQKAMSTLGIDAYTTDVNYEAMQTIMTQVTNWRDSTAGVDWNEELTNMIRFQKGFSACSRCLNAMDECLDRLVNSTGVVGR